MTHACMHACHAVQCRFYLNRAGGDVREAPEGVALITSYAHSFRLWLERWLRAMIKCVRTPLLSSPL